MWLFFKRSIGRLIVLVVGGLTTWFVVKDIFPYVDSKLPFYFAIFVTYLLAAYLIFPAVVRLVRLFLKPDHVPRFTTTPDGFWCDPVNVALVGTIEQVESAMAAIGWHKADPKNIKNVWRQGWSTLLSLSYPNAPFSTLFLFGRPQDIGFQKQVDGSLSKRHHVRFWAVTTDVSPRFVEHVNFWRRHYFAAHGADRYLWVGAATKDIGLIPIRHNLQLTHLIADDTNAERDYIISELKKAKCLVNVQVVEAGKPMSVKNRGFGAVMQSDGELHIAHLR